MVILAFKKSLTTVVRYYGTSPFTNAHMKALLKLLRKIRGNSKPKNSSDIHGNNTGVVVQDVETKQDPNHITVLLNDVQGRIRVVFQHGMGGIELKEGASMEDVLKTMNTEEVLKNLRPKITEVDLEQVRPLPRKRSLSLRKLVSPRKEENPSAILESPKSEVVVDLFAGQNKPRSRSFFGKPTSSSSPIAGRNRAKSHRLQAVIPPTEDEQKLLECLGDYKIGLPLFIRYCQTEFSVENIEIWKDLELNYSKINKPSMMNYLVIINDKFIDEKSTKEVNIPSKTKSRFVKLLDGEWMGEDYDGPMPTQVLSELKSDIKVNLIDTWTRFEVTQLYKVYNGFVRCLRSQAMM